MKGPAGKEWRHLLDKLRSPAFASYGTTGSGSVGATFQLAAMFGGGRRGGIEKTSLISLTSEERRGTAAHGGSIASPDREPKWPRPALNPLAFQVANV
jgi:hypothetical protein